MIRIDIGETEFRSFKLNSSNINGVEVKSDKINKLLNDKSKKLEKYLITIENIKNTINDIKNIIAYIDSLNLAMYENISFIQYGVNDNCILLTLYTHR